MTKENKAQDGKKQDQKQVLILVRRGKRGYIVEAAGSSDPYPCLEASDIGEAVIEILEDPDQQSVEYTTPVPDGAAAREAGPNSSADEGATEEGEPGSAGRPRGWTAGDEIIVGLASNFLQKARKFSDW